MSECFSSRLAQAIKSAGLSQRKFSQKAGITPGYLTDILKGRTQPSERVISSICKAHSLSEQWLVSGKGQMEAPAPYDQGETKIQRMVREHLDQFGEKGDEITESERRAVIMLRHLKPDVRNEILDELTEAYFLQIEEEQFPEK